MSPLTPLSRLSWRSSKAASSVGITASFATGESEVQQMNRVGQAVQFLYTENKKGDCLLFFNWPSLNTFYRFFSHSFASVAD
jgi:hypothetical protein